MKERGKEGRETEKENMRKALGMRDFTKLGQQSQEPAPGRTSLGGLCRQQSTVAWGSGVPAQEMEEMRPEVKRAPQMLPIWPLAPRFQGRKKGQAIGH